jgi:nucleoside-diphosphate-sugar epimerase
MEAERRLLARFRTDGLPVVIARLSGTVGPGGRGWVPFFSAAIRPNFRLVGNGTNRIQLGYVTDAADALIRCAETPDIDGEIFNISGVEPITVRAFVDEVRQTLGVPGAYGHLPAAPFRVYSHFAAAIFRLTRREIPRAKHYGMFLTQNEFDLSKARDRLGYEPQVTTAECARRMATYYREEGLV